MTGYGEAQRRFESLTVAIEVRTINSRYFKLSVRSSEGYNSLETQIDGVVRERIKRGTIQVNVRVEREPSPDDYRVNEIVLASYRQQLISAAEHFGNAEPPRLDSLLSLPGVVDERVSRNVDAAADWELIQGALEDALDHLATMRVKEGEAMANDLGENCQVIGRELEAIRTQAPVVVDAYRERITDRLNKMLAEFEVTVSPADIVREVGIFADRSDISEEIVRLRSHLDQFDATMQLPESAGRKLEFLTQEMFRETNTIGSKANDAQISQHVIEIKTAIERMREMIQNVE